MPENAAAEPTATAAQWTAARNVRLLPSITLSDRGGQGERAHCRRSARPVVLCGCPSFRCTDVVDLASRRYFGGGVRGCLSGRVTGTAAVGGLAIVGG